MTRSVGAGGFAQVQNFATVTQCRGWTQTILAREDAWIERDDDSWTFGNSWYQDLEAGNAHAYHANAMRSNELVGLLLGFKETLLRASAMLLTPDGSTLNHVRARHENLGPYWCEAGLHIFAGKPGVRNDVGVAHRDFEGLTPYPAHMFCEQTRAYSVVLAVAVPEVGGGLNVWEGRRLAADVFPEVEAAGAKVLRYETGTLTIIDSFLMHQIQPIICSSQKPLRISGVMHFLYLDKPHPHWEYWF